MPCYRHIGRAIRSVRGDKPAVRFNFADGEFDIYLDAHPKATAAEAHQFLNAAGVFCLEQEEIPLPFVPAAKGGASSSAEGGQEAEEEPEWVAAEVEGEEGWDREDASELGSGA